VAPRVRHHFQRWGKTTAFAEEGKVGISFRNNNVAPKPPRNCATIKSGTSTGRIPANVSESDLAIVTAGFAKEVDAVNQ